MDQQQIAGRGRDDRLSKLGDGVLGHILSFLSTKEAVRATALSSRWRDVFASVHTVSLEPPEEPVPDYDSYDRGYHLRQWQRDLDQPRPYTHVVSAALLARIRRPALVAASAPLRALRVTMKTNRGGDAFIVNQWVAYAIRLAAPEVEIELVLGQVPVCKRPDPLSAAAAAACGCDGHSAGGQPPLPKDIDTDDEHVASSDDERDSARGEQSPMPKDVDTDDEDVASSNDERDSAGEQSPVPKDVDTDDEDVASSDDERDSAAEQSPVLTDVDTDDEEDVASSDDERDSAGEQSSVLTDVDTDDEEDVVSSDDERDSAGEQPSMLTDVDTDDEEDVASSDDDQSASKSPNSPSTHNLEHTVVRDLFSFAALRSLRLGNCRLSPPAAISLPALETLSLTHVPDAEEHMQRLISACTCLTDLTLEACGTVTTLSLLDNTRLHRLVLRCCHKLASVSIRALELQTFEYRGAVPGNSFLTVPGGGLPSITSCKVAVCTVCLLDEAALAEQLARLGSLLQPFTSTKHLHLCAARMGSCFVALDSFPALRHLQLNGRVTNGNQAAAATSAILQRAPDLEALTLFFETGPHELETRVSDLRYYCSDRKKGELLDAHHLHYSKYDTLDLEGVPIPRCLASRVRRINLVHYQGGRAQRALARWLLHNALVLEKLHCELEEGPFWIQKELVREVEGWVVSEGASKVFH